jgi:hypothetical protein
MIRQESKVDHQGQRHNTSARRLSSRTERMSPIDFNHDLPRLSLPQSPSSSFATTGEPLLDKSEGPAEESDETTVDYDALTVLEGLCATVARQRGLQVEPFVDGLMALLSSEQVGSYASENPFEDPVVHLSGPDQAGRPSSSRSSMVTCIWTKSRPSLGDGSEDGGGASNSRY